MKEGLDGTSCPIIRSTIGREIANAIVDWSTLEGRLTLFNLPFKKWTTKKPIPNPKNATKITKKPK